MGVDDLKKTWKRDAVGVFEHSWLFLFLKFNTELGCFSTLNLAVICLLVLKFIANNRAQRNKLTLPPWIHLKNKPQVASALFETSLITELSEQTHTVLTPFYHLDYFTFHVNSNESHV